MAINKYVKWGTGALTGLALLIQACNSPNIENNDSNYNPDVQEDTIKQPDIYKSDNENLLEVKDDSSISSDGDDDSEDTYSDEPDTYKPKEVDVLDASYDLDTNETTSDTADTYIPETDDSFDSSEPDVGYDNYDIENDEVDIDECDGNCPPVVNAGPDLELNLYETYCLNFNCSEDDLWFVCGSTPNFAPGHSEEGFPNYDPDGMIIGQKIWQDLEGWPDFYFYGFDCALVNYLEPGERTLRYELTDNDDTSSYDDAHVVVIE